LCKLIVSYKAPIVTDRVEGVLVRLLTCQCGDLLRSPFYVAPRRRSQARRIHPTASSGVFSVNGVGEDAVMVALGCVERIHPRRCCHGRRQRVCLICLERRVVAATARIARWAAIRGGGVDLLGVMIVNKDGGSLDHLRLCCQLVAWGLLACLNKGGGPRVHLALGRISA
jgi:hypothetical protein